MISGQHVREEIEQLKTIEDKLRSEGKEFEAGLLKVNSLILKLLVTIRQNQVKTMPPELLKKREDNEA